MGTTQEKNQEQLEALSKMFEEFTHASSGVMEYYEHLERTVQQLSNELEVKNKQLNVQVAETEKTRSYINNILESISDGVVAVDLQGEIRACNKAALSIIGYAADEIVGQRISTLIVDERLFHENNAEHMSIAFTKSGFETGLDHKTGKEISVVLFSSPIYDENGMVIGAVLTFKDVSMIKKLEDEVERSSRLASIGEMAAGIAHEIRNPLGGIEMFASILSRDFDEADDRKRIVQSILEGVRSIDTIVSELLSFTRSLRKSNYQELHLGGVLSSALMFAEVELEKKNATVHTNFNSDSEVNILGDEDQLKQLFLNLFLNAAQALPKEGGVLDVSLQREDDAVSVVVTDNGSGIEKKNISKIFDPFFTTKSQGNGLGLAISYRIIEAHKGSVHVESRAGKGTTFTVRFDSYT